MDGLTQSVAGLKNKDQDFLKKKKFPSKLQHWLSWIFSLLACLINFRLASHPTCTREMTEILEISLSIVLHYVCYVLCFSSRSGWIHWGHYNSIHLLHCWRVLSFSHWVPGLRTGSGPKTGQRISTLYWENCLGLPTIHPWFLSIS